MSNKHGCNWFNSKYFFLVVCFYLHPKEQLIIIEDKIEQRLQIGRRQLNDVRYNMHKKLCMVTANIMNKKIFFIFF